MIQHLKTLFLLFVFTAPATAQLIVSIAPSGGNVVWTVEWTDLVGTGAAAPTFFWDSMNPATGDVAMTEPWGAIPQVVWNNVGNPFGSTYAEGSNRGFGHGFDGVVSDPVGWGVGPDHDPGGNADDVWIFNTAGASISSSGMFTLTVPGANIDKYNVGVYTNNANATVTVVPEPSAFLFLGLVGFGTVLQWKKRRIHSQPRLGALPRKVRQNIGAHRQRSERIPSPHAAHHQAGHRSTW